MNWDLTESEQRLWDAFPGGAWTDLRSGDPAEDDPARAAGWGAERVVRAEVITALLRGAVAPEPGRSPAVRVRGARVTGRLDLMGATVECALVCEHCHFDDPLRFVESTTRSMRLVHCVLPSLNAAAMRTDGILNLHDSTVRAGLRLDRARVVGEVTLRGVEAGPDPDGVAVAAQGLIVDGNVEMNAGFHATGSVLLRVARIEGVLDLTDARIDRARPGADALAISRSMISGGLFARGLVLRGEFAARNAQISGSVQLSAARLENPGGHALAGTGLSIEGPLWCLDGFSAVGEVRLAGARIRTSLALDGASLSDPGGVALDLNGADAGIITGQELTVRGGALTMVGTRIGTNVDLSRARLEGQGGALAINADNAVIGAGVTCSGMRAEGEVRIQVSTITGRVLLDDAHIDNPGKIALRLSRTTVGADVFCQRMTAAGTIKLTRSLIGGRLSLTDAKLGNPGGVALDGRALEVADLGLLPAEHVQGTVDLTHAKVGVLQDDPEFWPESLLLDGLTYDVLTPRLPARARLAWLARDDRGYQPQPYEQLAAHYATLGDPAEARRILLAKERRQRRTNTVFGRNWSVLQDLTVAYGYQPWRAVLWLALFLTIGSAVFAAEPPPPLKPGEAPHFNAIVYTLDLLVPLIDLGQERAFNPGGAYQWFSYLLVAVGWLFVTTIAAAVARVLTRR